MAAARFNGATLEQGGRASQTGVPRRPAPHPALSTGYRGEGLEAADMSPIPHRRPALRQRRGAVAVGQVDLTFEITGDRAHDDVRELGAEDGPAVGGRVVEADDVAGEIGTAVADT